MGDLRATRHLPYSRKFGDFPKQQIFQGFIHSILLCLYFHPIHFFLFTFFFLIKRFLKKIFIYLFRLRWVFVAARRLSLVASSGGYSSLGARAFHCSGFSWCGARALVAWASVVVAHGLTSCGLRALERRLGSCSAWA